MNRIYNIIVSAAAVAVLSLLTASCHMDRASSDSITFDKAFVSMESVEALERGAYSRLRTSINPYIMTVPDIQADYVNAVNGYSNTYGNFYEWSYAYDETEIESAWYYLYSGISQYNFIISGLRDRLSFQPTASEQASLDLVKGRMHFFRALSYSLLAERFCPDYDEATADTRYSGLPLRKTYSTSDVPDRSTLRETYDFILADLDTARTYLSGVAGSANSTEINADCITALQARVYLSMDNYNAAYTTANSLIANDAYSLVESEEDFRKMWVNDESTETIFQFYASQTETAFQWGYYFYQDYYNGMGSTGTSPLYMFTPDYIPTQSCLDMYTEGDWRRSVYFRDCAPEVLDADGSLCAGMIKGVSEFAQNLVIISKFPGNPSLRTSSAWNYYNSWKVFRLAEIYLIAAEAAAMSGRNSLEPLNELRIHRGLEPLTSSSILEVRAERYRELLMEGTRLADLKRWKLGLDRGEPQSGAMSPTGAAPWYYNHGEYVSQVGKDMTKDEGDYMFTWPIPASEIFTTPKFGAQQNPGWDR